MAPLTSLRPKALCPINNRPLVDWALERVTPLCGSLAVNVHHHRDQLLEHLGSRGVHLSLESPVALGTAGALGQLRDWIAGRAVLLSNADAWDRAGSGALAELIEGWDGERPRLRCARTSRRVDFDDVTYVGSALLPWWSVAELDPEPGGLYEVSWASLHEQGRLELVVIDDVPIDCGTPTDYLAANLTASGGRSVIGEGAVVEGEVIRSVVWPNSRVASHERLVNAVRAQDLTVCVPSSAAREE